MTDRAAETRRVQLRVSDRYAKEHPWVVPAITGFLSAYFMESPGFRVLRHYDELESGVSVWLCEAPAAMKVTGLLKRLQADIPPCRWTQTSDGSGQDHYLIDVPADRR